MVQIFHSTCQEYEKIVQDPNIKHKEKFFLANSNRAGAYQGCFSSTHWGGRRVAHKWDLLIKHAPKIAKRYAEVPNNLREVLNIEKHKWTGSKFKRDDGLHSVPEPLAAALEKLIMDRLSVGEEVSYDFVENTLQLLIHHWNDKVADLETEVTRTVQKKMLERQNEMVDVCGDDARLEAQQEDMGTLEKLLTCLQPCNVSTQPKAFGNLVRCASCSLFFDIFLY